MPQAKVPSAWELPLDERPLFAGRIPKDWSQTSAWRATGARHTWHWETGRWRPRRVTTPVSLDHGDVHLRHPRHGEERTLGDSGGGVGVGDRGGQSARSDPPRQSHRSLRQLQASAWPLSLKIAFHSRRLRRGCQSLPGTRLLHRAGTPSDPRQGCHHPQLDRQDALPTDSHFAHDGQRLPCYPGTSGLRTPRRSGEADTPEANCVLADPVGCPGGENAAVILRRTMDAHNDRKPAKQALDGA